MTKSDRLIAGKTTKEKTMTDEQRNEHTNDTHPGSSRATPTRKVGNDVAIRRGRIAAPNSAAELLTPAIRGACGKPDLTGLRLAISQGTDRRAEPHQPPRHRPPHHAAAQRRCGDTAPAPSGHDTAAVIDGISETQNGRERSRPFLFGQFVVANLDPSSPAKAGDPVFQSVRVYH